MQKLRIFAASPSDVAAERAKVEAVAGMLKPLADNLGIVLEVLDWRTVLPNMGRPEQVILDQLKPTSWDVFIGILWHRFGTPPGDKDPKTQKQYLSGTEEEFKTAYRLWKKHKKPRIMIYRCRRAIPPEVLHPDQYKRVEKFFKQFRAVKGEHPGLCQSFDTTDGFVKLLVDNLQKLLLDYAGDLKGKPIPPHVVQVYAPKTPYNLPRRAAFFGRHKEMHKVLGALSPDERGWGVVIDGIGGIGKTALALEAAHRTQDKKMFDAFVFVTAKDKYLTSEGIREKPDVARTVDDFVNETARVLGEPAIAQLTGDDKRSALLDALRGTRALLIYDNLETLEKKEQEALADFLRFLPQDSKAILTSRRRGGEGALWLRLEKLEWDAARQVIADEAKKDARLSRKLQHAGEARWQELYDETKGSPLALVHVLGLMRTRTVLTFDGALELMRGSRDADLQEFVFKEARKELGKSEVSALRALSFFVPSASFEALMEVANLSRNIFGMTLDRLDALSLLDKLEGVERFALHPLTRNFVRDELLADAKIAREIGRSFAGYWVDYAGRYGRDQYKTYDRIDGEWANLHAAADWLWQTAAVHGENVGDNDAGRSLNDLADALCKGANPLFYIGRWDESLQLSARAYSAVRALRDYVHAAHRAFEAVWIQWHRAKTEEAGRWADRCAEACAHGGGKHLQAMGARVRGLVATQRKDYDTAGQLLQDALAIYRDLKDDSWVAIALNDLGGLEYERKRYDAAKQYFREALDIHQRRADARYIATLLGNLGEIALVCEDWAEARDCCEKASELAQEVGRQDLVASQKYRLARVHEAKGRAHIALPLAQEAVAIYERLRDKDLADAKELVERLKRKTAKQQ